MRALIQRVSEAKVKVAEKIVGNIGQGLLVFLGFRKGDTKDKLPWLTEKLTSLRLFSDKEEKMNLSLSQIEGEILLVSQFTLYGDCHAGRRPSFTQTMPREHAYPLYQELLSNLKDKLGKKRVSAGQFGAMMEVHLVNDGPVTFLLEK